MTIAAILELLRARLLLDPASWVIGEDKLADHEATSFATPRYVWVPTRDRFGPPERAGGNPRQLLTRTAGLELHLWAESVADAEARMLAVIDALMAMANTSVSFEAANWAGPSILGRGARVIVELRVKVPVTRSRVAVQPTTVEHDASSAVQGDGVLDAGETT